ncbi:uncharacterized protein LOC135138928 isoform X2 [Zophobas morio]
MDATQLLLNEQLVTITGDALTIKRLNQDDQYLADYVNRAAKAGQFHFLFIKDPTLRRIVVKRVPSTFIPVWCKKGKRSDSESDTAACLLLLKLRNTEKYLQRFQDGGSENKVWEELASEMRLAGYDVDAQKCAQKFAQLTQSYRKRSDCQGMVLSPEMRVELRKVLGEKKGESEEEDEEWLPKSKKRKKNGEEDDAEFLKRFLKRSGELKEERFKEVCTLMKRRNELLEERLKQNREVVEVLAKLLNK